MFNRPEISVIVPAYNEVRSIARTITEVRAYFDRRLDTHEIIVAADGNDGTREVVGEMARSDSMVRVIGGVERRGKGHGVRTAVSLTRGRVIGYIDADNKTPIEEFDKVEPLLRGGCDIVIGSRAMQGALIERPQPRYRRLGATAFRVFMHLVIGLHDIPDTQCGFKFFRRDVALDLFSRQQIDGYMFDVEILFLARQAGYRIRQVPVRWRDDGDSRLRLVTGNLRNLIDILRIRRAAARHRA